MWQELEALDKLEHPHIVQVLDLCEDNDNVYIVAELMRHGTLTQMLTRIQESKASFTERDGANLIYQLLIAINFLHKQNVVHRDLKLDNILVSLERIDDTHTKVICKVTDFGFTKAMNPQQKETLCLGTPIYMAPELVMHKAYDSKVDIWALGVLAYIIFTGRPPFKHTDLKKLTQQISQKELDLDEFSEYYQNGEQIKDFLTKCLAKNPHDRMTAAELLEHPWIKTMVIEEPVDECQKVKIALNLYTFKRSSVLQSSVIGFLSRLKSDSEELTILRKVFMELDTSKDGFLSVDEIKDGFKRIQLSDDTLIAGSTWAAFKSRVMQPDFSDINSIQGENGPLTKEHTMLLERLVAAQIAQGNMCKLKKPQFMRSFNMQLGKGKDFEPDWDKLVKCIDVNNDGLVGFDEFVTAASDRYRLITGENHLKQAFDILDINKDGTVTIDELKECFSYGILGSGPKMEKADRVGDDLWEQMLADIDTNKDGKIDFDEFKEHMMGLIKKGRYEKRDNSEEIGGVQVQELS